MFGGTFGSYTTSLSNQTWAYKGGTWTNLTSASGKNPPALAGAAMGYDQKDGYFVLFGGIRSFGGSNANETWKYANGTWTNLTGSLTTAPTTRYSAPMVYDPIDGYLLLFGGHGGSTVHALADTWEFSGGKWKDLTGSTGGTPPPRGYQSVAYDARLNSVVMFGGRDYPGSGVYNDTWTFAHGTWTNASTNYSTAPSERRGAMMAFDALRGYDLLFGGDNPILATTYSDTWVLSSQGWTNLTAGVGSGPTGRFYGGLWFDNSSRSMVLFGGCTMTGCPGADGDTWRYVWNLSATLTPSSTRLDVNTTLSLSTAASGGAWSYSYHYYGLPAGCATANRATLTCVPSAPGNFSPYVVVTDAYAPAGGTPANFTAAAGSIQIFAALHLALVQSAAQLDLGQLVWLNATAAGGAGAYTFLWSGLPPGCAPGNVSKLLCSPTAVGAFQPVVIVRDTSGASLRSTGSLTVYSTLAATVSASTTSVEVGQPVTFSVLASGGSAAYGYVWFGLPSGCTGSNVPTLTCTLTAAGPVTVSVSVKDTTGWSVTAAAPTVQARPLPYLSVGVTPASGQAPLLVAFTGSAYAGFPPYTFNWEFGDGSSSTRANVTHTYTHGGVYDATLWVNDSIYGHSSASVVVTVISAPSVSVSAAPSVLEVGLTTTLHATVTGGTAPFVYAWAGLPTACPAANISAIVCAPSAPANYTITVTVTDQRGASASSTIHLDVRAAVTASIEATPESGCGVPFTVDFTADALGGVAPYSYLWQFGDGTSGNTPVVNHTYATQPPGAAKLTITDSLGASASSTSSAALRSASCNPFSSFLSNPVAIAGVAIAAAVVLGTVAFVLFRRRARRATEGVDVPPPEVQDELPPM